jgi:hypothetical protein
VAKDDLRVASWDTKILEQGRSRVPQVVNLDVTEIVGVADAVE